MSIKTVMAAAAVALGTVPLAHAQSLTGSQVSGAIYCCTAPTEAYRATNLVTDTVGSQVEFPDGVFTSLVPGLRPVSANLDIGANTIDLQYLESAPASSGQFDGYVLSFQNAPAIANVSVDPSSTFTPTSLSFNANTVFINDAALALTPQSHLLLNVTAVPEPVGLAMMLGGLGVLGLLARGRKQRAAQDR